MSASDVHPTAIGTGVRPRISPEASSTSPDEGHTTSGTGIANGNRNEAVDGSSGGEGPDDVTYPEQRHSGAVGYGPTFAQGARLGDKITGIQEEIRGKIKRNPELVEQGRKRRTGELKHEQTEHEEPFGTPAGNKPQSPTSVTDTHAIGRDKSHFEQAAIVAPEGTSQANLQRNGDAGSNMKHIHGP